MSELGLEQLPHPPKKIARGRLAQAARVEEEVVGGRETTSRQPASG